MNHHYRIVSQHWCRKYNYPSYLTSKDGQRKRYSTNSTASTKAMIRVRGGHRAWVNVLLQQLKEALENEESTEVHGCKIKYTN